MCVCVYHASCYILPDLYVEKKVPFGFLWHFQDLYCVDFVKNALFKNSGDTCSPPLPSSLLDELLMDKRDSDGFISRRIVCRTSDSSYNSTGSPVVTVGYQLRFLALLPLHMH